MEHADHDPGDDMRRQRRPSPLDSRSFIRARLFGDDRSALVRYADLTFGTFSWPRLIRHELLATFVAPFPGGLGLLLRRWLFPPLFRAAGRDVIFGPNLTLRHADRITLGDGVVLDRDCLLDARGAGERGIVIGNRVIVSAGAAIQAKVGHIEIGDDCNIGAGVHIVAQGPVIIGEHVSIAGNAMIAGGRHAVAHAGADRSRFTSGPIRIGRNATIGMGAIVQDGVAIGANAIVAPGAVVFEDVPGDTVVWGNPARPLRSRPGHPPATPAPPPGPEARDRPADGELARRVRDYLREDLFIEFGPGEFGDTDSLVDAGVLDSLAFVRLALWIEQTFRVEADPAAMSLTELDSVEKIAAWIARRVRT